MPRRPPPIPEPLRRGPFTIRQAAEADRTWDDLQTARYRRLPHGIYAPAYLPQGPLLLLQAARLRLPPVAVFSGLTAAWLHGLDVPAVQPIEANVPKQHGMASCRGVLIRRSRLAKADLDTRQGLPVTSLVRTLLDLAETRSLSDAVVVADMALHERLLTVSDLQTAVQARAGSRFAARRARLLDNVEPLSESAMESRLRIILVEAGLPRPQAQAVLRDPGGSFLGRADLYYPSHRLALEYDGGTHRDSLVSDNRRQNRILAAGITIRRFTAPDVLGCPDQVAAQVRGQLSRPPRPTESAA